MDFGPIDYASNTAPALYCCKECGRTGCKLWREYNTFADHQTLLCCDCSAKEQKKDIASLDAEGRHVDDLEMRTDQIGMRMPAVPTVEGDTYWGYTSVPQEGVRWWKNLPNRPPEEPKAPEIPPPCDREVFQKGKGICIFHASPKLTERWVRRVAAESGQRVDWHYSCGWVNMLYLGDYEKVRAAVEKLQPALLRSAKRAKEPVVGFRILPPETHGLFRRGVSAP